MSSGVSWRPWSNDKSSHLDDVSFAWDTLNEAKEAFQRVEDRIDAGDQRRARAQRIRRRLQLDRNEEGTENAVDKGALKETVSPGPFVETGRSLERGLLGGTKTGSPLPRIDDGSISSSLIKEDHSSGTPSKRPLWNKLPLGESSAIRTMENTVEWSEDLTRPDRHSYACTPHALEKSNTFTDDATARTYIVSSVDTLERDVGPVSSTHQPSPICNIVWSGSPPYRSRLPCHGSPLSTPDGHYAQKLECLKSKSPERKLEKLKDRIREQRRRLTRVPPGQLGSSFWQVNDAINKSSLRHTVRKVTFAPPPPVYRGFSSVNMELTHLNTDETILKPVTEAHVAVGLKYGGHTEAKTQTPANEQKQNHLKGKLKHGAPEKSISKSSNASQKERDQVTKLYGASAWRQGQRLVRKLLGPPSAPLKLTSASVHEPKSPNHESARAMGDPTKVMKESVNAKIPKNQSLENFVAMPTNQEKGILSADSKSAKNARQVLGPLYSHSQHHNHGRSPDPGLHRHTPDGSPEEQEKLHKDDALDAEVNPKKDSCRSGRSASPQRSRTSSWSPLGKHSNKENLPQCSETKTSTRKVRSYSVEEVRKFMNRKLAEKQKKELEAKKAMKKASELKNKRMKELFQKQKKAFPKRERSQNQQMANKITSQTSNELLECNESRTNDQSCSRTPENNVSEWIHLTSQALLKDEGSECSVFDSKKSWSERRKERKSGLKLTFVLPSETQFTSPLKHKDLDLSEDSSPKSLTFLRSLQSSDLKSSSPEPRSQLILPAASSQLSPFRSKEERILAIHVVAKELEERIQVEANRLRMTNSQQRSCDKEITSTMQETVRDPSVKPDRFQNELNRMLSLSVPTPLPILESLKVSSKCIEDKVGENAHSRPLGGRGPLIIVKQNTKQTTACTLLPSHTTASEQLPWSSDPALLTNNGPTQHAEDILQSPLKGPKTTLQTHHTQDPTAVSSSESLSRTRSPLRKAAEHEYGSMDTPAFIQNSKEAKSFYPPEKIPTFTDEDDSHNYETRIKNMIRDLKENSGQESTPQNHPRENSANHLAKTPQKNLPFFEKLKRHELRREQELALLIQKVEQEAQKSLDELRKKRLTVDSSKSNLGIRHGADGDNQNLTEKCLLANQRRTMLIQEDATEEQNSSVLKAGKAGRTAFVFPEAFGDGLREASLAGPAGQKGYEKLAIEDSGDSSEPTTDSTSQWSEICLQAGGPPKFSRFTLEMAQQYLRDEELRARHQAALLRLREEALKEKTEAELALLEHQKTRFENRKDYEKVADIVQKQQEILNRLQQEQAEISHLQNIYKASHQERKLLLRHQRELLQMQQSTAQLLQKLQVLEDRTQNTTEPDAAMKNEKSLGFWILPTPTIPSDATPVFEKEAGHVQIDDGQCKEGVSHLAQKEKMQPKRKLDTTWPKDWKLRIETESIWAPETENKKLDDAPDPIRSQRTEETSDEDQEIPDESDVPSYSADLPDPRGGAQEVLKQQNVTKEKENNLVTESSIKSKDMLYSAKPNTENNLTDDIGPGCTAHIEKLPVSQMEAQIPELKITRIETREPKEQLEEAGSSQKWDDGHKGDSDSDTPLSTPVKSEIMTDVAPGQAREKEDEKKEREDMSYVEQQETPKLGTLHNPGVMAVKEDVLSYGDATFGDGEQIRKHVNEDDQRGLATESSLKESVSDSLSNNSSHRSESLISCPSLCEFQKVSAFLINVSGSSASLSGTDNAQDTDISDSEVFDSDKKTSEKLSDTEKNVENPLLIINRSGNSPVSEFSSASSYALKQRLEVHNTVSESSPNPVLHSDVLSGNKSQSHNILMKEELLEGVEGQFSETSASPLVKYIGIQIPSQQYSGPGEYMDALPASQKNPMSSISEFSETGKRFTQQALAPEVGEGKSNGETKTFASTRQPKIENMDLLSEDVTRPVDANNEYLGNTLALQPDTPITEPKMAPLASECEDLSLSEEKSDTEYLTYDQGACKPNEIPATKNLSALDARKLGESAAEGMASLDKDFPRKTSHKEKKPAKTNLISTETQNKPFPPTPSNAFDPIICIAPVGKSNIVLITDEVLPSIDEDTLSEILSPVDEQLSYGSSEFPSTKMELSCQSDDLPSFPDDASTLSDDANQNPDDFPSPPEEIILLECESGVNKGLSLIPDELPVNSTPMPPSTLSHSTSLKDENNAIGWPKQEHVVEKNTTSSRDVNENSRCCLQSTHSPASPSQDKTIPTTLRKNRRPFLTLSTEEDCGDALLSFEIGDRVLVKHTHPGTLKFKGKTQFDQLFWAGVALDKPEGDHDGTYEGIRYFECAKLCGVFVRPHQISHLLEGDDKSVEGSDDEDSFFDGPASGTNNSAEHQGTMFTQKKSDQCEKRNPSVWSEKSSQMSRSTTTDKRASSSQSYVHAGKRNTSAETLSVSTEVKQEISEQQCDLTTKWCIKDGAMRGDERERLEHMLNQKDCLQLLPGWKEVVADRLCHQILKELLCDTVNVFSGTSRHKHAWTFEGGGVEQAITPKSKDAVVEEEYDDSSQTPTESVSDLLWQVARLANPAKSSKVPSSNTARQIEERILSKFIEDAMKEYKKIKRKQRGENTMRDSQDLLPLLRKVLDAGVFGECDYFDQPPVETTEELSLPRLKKLKLDRWCTAQWKTAKELSLVVPHNVPYVKNLATRTVEELWAHHNLFPVLFRPAWTELFECEALEGDGRNAESTRMYNRVIIDLTQELLEREWPFPKSRRRYPWEKEKVGSWFSKQMPRKRDLNEVKSLIQAEILRILKLEGEDLVLQRKLQKMAKFGSCKRDLVDRILIQELHQEERQWTDYAEDEQAVKMKLTDDILNSLVHDTIGVLRNIYIRRTHE